MQIMRSIAYVLVIVGAIVWGAVGLFNFNMVAAMFGDATVLSRIIYSLVGIAGIYLIATTGQEECYCEYKEDTHYY